VAGSSQRCGGKTGKVQSEFVRTVEALWGSIYPEGFFFVGPESLSIETFRASGS
jgi:hypothetical protein